MGSLTYHIRTGDLTAGDDVIYRHWVWRVTAIVRGPMDNATNVTLKRHSPHDASRWTETITVQFLDRGPYDENVLRQIAQPWTRSTR